MSWEDLGSIAPIDSQWLNFPIPFTGVGNYLLIKLEYGSAPETNDGYGFLRLYYPYLNSYSEKWEQIYAKKVIEEITVIQDFFPSESKILQVRKKLYYEYGRKHTDYQWVVSAKKWTLPWLTASINDTNIIQAIENIPITINQTIENNTVLAQGIAQEVIRQNQLTNQQVVTEILTFFTGGV